LKEKGKNIKESVGRKGEGKQGKSKGKSKRDSLAVISRGVVAAESLSGNFFVKKCSSKNTKCGAKNLSNFHKFIVKSAIFKHR